LDYIASQHDKKNSTDGFLHLILTLNAVSEIFQHFVDFIVKFVVADNNWFAVDGIGIDHGIALAHAIHDWIFGISEQAFVTTIQVDDLGVVVG